MGLGGVGVTLHDLTMLYAGLARLGTTRPLIERIADRVKARPPQRLLDPVAAWQIGNVLIGAPPPENAVGGRIAFKTGTSYGYRDAWSIGFDGKYTIGVWIGRPDGAPVPGILGRTAAAPILFDAFARLGTVPAPLPPAPKGALIASTAKLPPPLQRFDHAGRAAGSHREALRILFPPDGARLDVARRAGAMEPVALKIAGGQGPWTVFVNGVPLADKGPRRMVFWSPDGPGFARLTVTDAGGAAESVVVRIQ
jgi:penicillin-binding protein 1C